MKKICPNCKSKLKKGKMSEDGEEYDIYKCDKCGWWGS